MCVYIYRGCCHLGSFDGNCSSGYLGVGCFMYLWLDPQKTQNTTSECDFFFVNNKTQSQLASLQFSSDARETILSTKKRGFFDTQYTNFKRF